MTEDWNHAAADQDAAPKLTKDAIARILGDILDEKVVAIAETGADEAVLEAVVAWSASAEEQELPPLDGLAAEVYAILTADEPQDDER